MNQISHTELGEVIDNAIFNEEVIRFDYFGANITLRTLSPYEVSEDGQTILGFDHMRCELRRFDLSKIDSVRTTDEEYVNPIEKEVS